MCISLRARQPFRRKIKITCHRRQTGIRQFAVSFRGEQLVDKSDGLVRRIRLGGNRQRGIGLSRIVRIQC